MEKGLLSVCILAKNNSDVIYKTLNSVNDIADEIIIFNLRSDSEKLNVVKNKVKLYKVDNDEFNKNSNMLIKEANSEWILLLKDEEVLNDYSKERIREFLNEANSLKGLYVRKISIIDGKRRMSYNTLRLFKNDNKIILKENVYDDIFESISKNYGNGLIHFTDLEIQSYENDKDVNSTLENSINRIEKMNDSNIKNKSYIHFFNLGNEYGKIGDFNLALENYNIALKEMSDTKILNENILKRLLLNRIKAYHQLELYNEEEEAIVSARSKYKDFRDLYFMECLMRIQLCEFSKGSIALRNYIDCNKKIEFPSSEFEEIINIEELYKNISSIDNILS
ncbi:MAG: hypothetical protein ACRCVJ_10230 [Clostridium sp.]|uniref:hypothetical protein n=1 Tax=Clostridium sp. TaxID=1506 RepID=UPI003F3E5734